MDSNEQIAAAIKADDGQYFRDLDGEPPSANFDMVMSRCVERPLLEIVLLHAKGTRPRLRSCRYQSQHPAQKLKGI